MIKYLGPNATKFQTELLKLSMRRFYTNHQATEETTKTSTVCNQILTKKQYCVQCTNCNEWLHLPCSDFHHINDYRQPYVAPCSQHYSPSNVSPPATTGSFLPQNAASPPIQPQVENQEIISSPSSFKILQWNCNGLRGCIQELLWFMERHDIKVAALQETKMTSIASISTPNYSLVRVDR